MTVSPDYLTPDERQELLQCANEKVGDLAFHDLFDRWQWEKDHEDWNEYSRLLVREMESLLPTGSVAKVPRRGSFNIICSIPGFPHDVKFYVNNIAFGWTELKERQDQKKLAGGQKIKIDSEEGGYQAEEIEPNAWRITSSKNTVLFFGSSAKCGEKIEQLIQQQKAK